MEEEREGLSSPSAIESEAVWERFRRSDNEDIISRLVSPNDFFSKKDLYHPTLMDEGTLSFALEKSSGKRCYMLGPKKISITNGDDPQCWMWISPPDSRFSEVLELVNVCRLEIKGKMETRLLSMNTTYAAYLVYKFKERTLGFQLPVKVFICFEELDWDRIRWNIVNLNPEGSLRRRWLQQVYRRKQGERKLVKEREDGWLEIKMGEFFNDKDGREDREVYMDLEGTKEINHKSGLIIQGIELRPKETTIVDSNRDHGESDRTEAEERNKVDFVMPKGCFSNTLSLKTSRYVRRQQTSSSTFRWTLESDAVWERIMPPDYKDILSRSGSPHLIAHSKKYIYNYLCSDLILMDERKMSVALDKWSAKKTYMFGARQLLITWGNDSRYWMWQSLQGSRFSEVAKVSGAWLEFYGKMKTRELSPKTTYVAYVVYKFTKRTEGLVFQPLEVYLRFMGGAGEGSHTAYLDPDGSLRNNHRNTPEEQDRGKDEAEDQQNRKLKRDVKKWMQWERGLPRERGNGWMEIEMGEFFNDQGEDGDVDMGLHGMEGSYWKSGLVIEGIEFRPKELSPISWKSPSTQESEAFWERLLPSDYREVTSTSSSPPPLLPSSKKDLFFHLCFNPILSDNMSFALERRSGKKCYMLGARKLTFTWGDDPRYWTWKSLHESRFSEVAQLSGAWLEIHGMMDTGMLSQKTTYAAYFVFKFEESSRRNDHGLSEVYLRFVGGAGEGIRTICLDPDDIMWGAHRNSQEQDVQKWLQGEREFPRVRGDGWKEIEMGEFFNDQGKDGVVDMGLKGDKGLHWKSGLIIQGIELRPKESWLVSSSTPSTVQSDKFWEKLLPPDYENIISTSVSPSSVDLSSKKNLYFHLCFHPILIHGGRTSFAIEKRSGKKCFMLGARNLQTKPDDSQNLAWRSSHESRFTEVAQLLRVCHKIYGKMETRILSPKTTYAAYLVFKFAERTGNNDSKPLVVYLKSDEDSDEKSHNVHLDPDRSLRKGHPSEERDVDRWLQREKDHQRERGNGWLEIEMGEFFNDNEDDRKVEMGLKGMEGLNWNSDLIIEGIELRPKESPLLDSNAFWERFLRPDYQESISSWDCASLVDTLSKKDIYFLLCFQPILIDDGKMSFVLDELSKKKCFMIGARNLSITWGDEPRYWTWRSLPEDSRFSEVAVLVDVCWLEIHGYIKTQRLSPKTIYAAYLVFKFTERTHGLDCTVKVSVKVRGIEVLGSSSVCLDPDGILRKELKEDDLLKRKKELPFERKDGWIEIWMGDFPNYQREDWEMDMSLMEVDGRHWKSGLIIQGIELRPTESPLLDSNAFWERFLPPDYQESISSWDCASLVDTLSMKDIYFLLCFQPILIDDGKMSFVLEEQSKKKRYMLGARKLSIERGNDPQYWTWRCQPDSRFLEVAVLQQVSLLEIHGCITTQILSPNTTYEAYLVFKFAEENYGLDSLPVKLCVKVREDEGAGSALTPAFRFQKEGSRSIYLDPDGSLRKELRNSNLKGEDLLKRKKELPLEREDEWIEIWMGDFDNDQGEDREVVMHLLGEERTSWKSGLVVQGIEVRPKDESK